MQNYPLFIYWIIEREAIRIKKEKGDEKPWSYDPVFQETYFCNVRREDDKVTKWIRKNYNPYVFNRMFEFNIVLSRFLNWPATLEKIGFLEEYVPEFLNARLRNAQAQGKVWGNAYVVTTHGMKMDKIDYLTHRVLLSANSNLPLFFLRSCSEAAEELQKIEGISTFMAAQIVADLKHTPHHPLQEAHDFYRFALPGPGSRRGMSWLYDRPVSDSEWYDKLMDVQQRLCIDGWELEAQDVQNCLCEFDKYMRVKNETGRSKRKYNGA